MIVRPATREDLEPLAALARKTYAHAFGHSLTQSDLAWHFHARLSSCYFGRALEEDVILLGQLHDYFIAFIQFGDAGADVAEAPDDQEIRRLYVLSNFQNRGIGSKLMDTAFAYPRLRSAANIYLDVWERNESARRFYERRGFAVAGSRPFAVASGIATDRDLIMVCRQTAARASRC